MRSCLIPPHIYKIKSLRCFNFFYFLENILKKMYIYIKKSKSKMAKKQSNPVCYYDFTLHVGSEFEEDKFREIKEVFLKKFEEICSICVFQLELGSETKIYHFQGRFKLKQRQRDTAVRKIFREDFPNIHISVTSTEVVNKNDWSYVEKASTRIWGPFTLLTYKEDKERQNAIKAEADRIKNEMPLILKDIKLRPFQEQIVELLKMVNFRHIDILYNPLGCIGKSVLSRYLKHYGISFKIPGGLGDHLVPFACSWVIQNKHLPPPKSFHFDLPKAFFLKNKEKIYNFWEQIENLKDGMLYDWRQTTRMVDLIQNPNVLIFTNRLPDLSCLSIDRIRIWSVDDNLNLVAYKHDLLPIETYQSQLEVLISINEKLGIKYEPKVVEPQVTFVGSSVLKDMSSTAEDVSAFLAQK